MDTPYTRAPHRGSTGAVQPAPNAALLVDFDNVTMGMRSDLSKDLQKLLQSDIIKGKVTVQRAYADWRRYPQYIVPLSENSIDLIFAPAYGSSKKNATDIRMAIDGMELVFTRPEIGTFILLTGDSDFSSLVLKLKEYGKYVIGVGIQESSSDILVQNCDEYYSYTSLTGLQKTDETSQKPKDPWVLVEEAIKKMQSRNDVMRSDRLKQVMVEIDAAFDEGNFGFSKFSRFLTEAASKGLVHLKKMDNGQYEIAPGGGRGAGRPSTSRGGGRGGRRSERSGRDRGRPEQKQEPKERRAPAPSEVKEGEPLKQAYDLLLQALDRTMDGEKEAVRDSDVKRKMLNIDRSFDEAELGFSKFSRFLAQADDHDVIRLRKRESGNFEVSPAGAGGLEVSEEKPRATAPEPIEEEAEKEEVLTPRRHESAPEAREEAPSAPSKPEAEKDRGLRTGASGGARLGPRRGSTRRRGDEGPPPLLEGQAPSIGGDGSGSEESAVESPKTGAVAGSGELDLARLGLPTDEEAAVRYLSNSYKGVGIKTAEALVEGFGDDLFPVLHKEPHRIEEVVPAGRAEAVIDAWKDDYGRRSEKVMQGEEPASGGNGGQGRSGGRRTRRGRR